VRHDRESLLRVRRRLRGREIVGLAVCGRELARLQRELLRTIEIARHGRNFRP
jgi:hypothetical protein